MDMRGRASCEAPLPLPLPLGPCQRNSQPPRYTHTPRPIATPCARAPLVFQTGRCATPLALVCEWCMGHQLRLHLPVSPLQRKHCIVAWHFAQDLPLPPLLGHNRLGFFEVQSHTAKGDGCCPDPDYTK